MEVDEGSAASAAAGKLWRTYGEHASMIFWHGPARFAGVGKNRFFVLSGAQHVDLNQVALYGAAGPAEAMEIGRMVADADVPALLGCSEFLTDDIGPALQEAGFMHFETKEHLFEMAGVPVPAASPFDVRRMERASDIAAMQAMFEDVHGYDADLTDGIFGGAVRADDGVTGWIAWDGDEPVSLAFVTACKGALGLWDVITPVRHRRRGAARAVVVGGLNAVAQASLQPIERTVFWSSPLGRPLYEALGFTVADTVDVWAKGASEADLAAVGAG